MYLSLYRKYRPQNFDDVYGQKIIVKIIKNQLKNNKLSHAYLFSGPRGTGKTSIAKILARLVNCENSELGIMCNKCVFCTQNNENLTDIIEIDAASNNGVDEIREIRSKVQLVPNIGKYKVYIIDEVHMLTTSAFNALLKTLEEPPFHVIFILATTEAHKVPETILSRCQKLEFKRILDNEIVDRLRVIADLESIEITDLALKEIARISKGGLRDAIGLLEQLNAYCDSKVEIKDIQEIHGNISLNEIAELLISISNKDLKNSLQILRKYYEDGKQVQKIVDDILFFVKNSLISNRISDYFENEEERKKYIEINDHLSEKDMLILMEVINNKINDFKITSDPIMLVEILIIEIISKIKIEEIPKVKIEEQVQDFKKIKIVEKKNITKEDNNLNKFKEVRVNNTFCNVSKMLLNDIRETFENLNLSAYSSSSLKLLQLLMDANIPAASKTNLIFVYETEGIVDYFYNNIKKLEQIVYEIFNIEYSIVALTNDEWLEYRDEFKSKKKTYTYVDDTEYKDEILNNTKVNENVFADLIEVK